MLGKSLQGIGEHYIAISLEQAHVPGHFEDRTILCLLWCEDELGDALTELLTGNRSIAS